MDTLAFWIATCANAVIGISLMLHYRGKLRGGLIADGLAKKRYSWAWLPIGLLVAVILFYTLVALFDAPTGHGEILIAAPIP
jgi:hypothetical protein